MQQQISAEESADNVQASDDVMHTMEFGKTQTFFDQFAAPGAKGKMSVLNALRILLPGYDSAFSYAALIGVIIVRIDSIYMKRYRQSPQFVQIPVFTCTETMVAVG